MKSEEFLFNLVHALTESEVKAVRNGLSKQMRTLFDELRGQERYNKPQVLERLKMTHRKKLLSSLKVQTADWILTILTGGAKSRDRLSVLSRTPKQVEFLINRGFYNAAEKRILHAIRIADDLEMFGYYLALFELWQQLSIRKVPTPPFNRELEFAKERIREIRTQSIELQEQVESYYEIADLVRTPRDRTRKVAKLTQHLHSQKSIDSCLSIRSKVYYLQTNYAIQRALQNVELVKEHSERIISILKENSPLLCDPAMAKILAKHLFHSGLFHIEGGEFEKALETILEIREIGTQNGNYPMIEPEIQQITWVLDLNLEREKGNWRGIPEILDSIVKNLATVNHREADPTIRVVLLYVSSLSAIYVGHFDIAWKLQLMMQNELKHRTSPLFSVIGRLFELIILFERKEFDLLENATRRTKRFFNSYGYTSPFTFAWINMFRAISKHPNLTKNRFPLLSLQRELDNLKGETQYFDYLRAFDYHAWIQAKLQNTSISRILTLNSDAPNR